VLRRGTRSSARTGTPADLLVVGIGNPGEEYSRTRHNVGAEVVDILARRHGGRLRKSRELRAIVDEVRVNGRRLALAVPTTYMNDSGQAVAPLARRFAIGEFAGLRAASGSVTDETESSSSRPFGTIGYKEAAAVVANEMPLAEAVAETKRRTRAYAKRQMTWLRSERNVHWIDSNDRDASFAAAMRLIHEGER